MKELDNPKWWEITQFQVKKTLKNNKSVVDWKRILNESLILAQDERWRRA